MAPRFRDSSLAVDAALLAVALMWASTFALFKVAWREVDPVAFTAVRFGGMVVLAFGVLALSRGRIRPRRADLPLLAASGLLGYFLYQMGFILGLDRTTAVASAILISTHPIWAVVSALVVGRERPTRAQAAGIALGFLGVAVFLRAWNAVTTVSFGDLLALGAAACFGAYGVVTQPLSKRYPSRLVMAYGLAVGGTLVALVGAPAVVHQDWGRASGSTWLILVYATVGPVFLAYALWNWAIKQRGIARTVAYGFAVPVLAAALAVIGLGESIRPEQAVGAIMIVAGLVITRLGHAPQRPALEESAPPVAVKPSEERARP